MCFVLLPRSTCPPFMYGWIYLFIFKVDDHAGACHAFILRVRPSCPAAAATLLHFDLTRPPLFPPITTTAPATPPRQPRPPRPPPPRHARTRPHLHVSLHVHLSASSSLAPARTPVGITTGCASCRPMARPSPRRASKRRPSDSYGNFDMIMGRFRPPPPCPAATTNISIITITVVWSVSLSSSRLFTSGPVELPQRGSSGPHARRAH